MSLNAIVSVLLAGLLVYAAVRKLSHEKSVVESYARVGVPEGRLNLLASLLLLASLGLLVGLWWRLAGIVTSAALTLYFSAALAAHVRWKDTKHLLTPIL